MKRTTILLFIALLTSQLVHAQMLNPVKWSYAAKKTSKTEAIVYIRATIEDGWHLYSQFVGDGGPVKTTFTFQKAPTYTLVGTPTESKPIKRNEPVFKMMVSFFEKTALFQQKIKLKGNQATVKGSVEFMVCNDTQCLPPSEVSFNILVK